MTKKFETNTSQQVGSIGLKTHLRRAFKGHREVSEDMVTQLLNIPANHTQQGALGRRFLFRVSDYLSKVLQITLRPSHVLTHGFAVVLALCIGLAAGGLYGSSFFDATAETDAYFYDDDQAYFSAVDEEMLMNQFGLIDAGANNDRF